MKESFDKSIAREKYQEISKYLQSNFDVPENMFDTAVYKVCQERGFDGKAVLAQGDIGRKLKQHEVEPYMKRCSYLAPRLKLEPKKVEVEKAKVERARVQQKTVNIEIIP
ncbi:MAG: hypothetical protein HC852_11075 [Acaryochloridaceae cyanobacterium RU_4_10]|nr:hypothetical protein [Acaryochloridaceae cyanobacterium RU_4_10]